MNAATWFSLAAVTVLLTFLFLAALTFGAKQIESAMDQLVERKAREPEKPKQFSSWHYVDRGLNVPVCGVEVHHDARGEALTGSPRQVTCPACLFELSLR